ncbi:MAG: fimbrial protein [Fibrobacteraceae bacterium]|nr:fimbrial protein [Fibrobacteraceae bacterium]
MKNAFNSILLLTVVGFAVLVAGACYFGAPLFGWIIMIAIFAVFVIEQISSMSRLKQMNVEMENIEKCEKSRLYNVGGKGVVASRIQLARRLLDKGIRLDSPIAFDVLSTGSAVAVPRSSSGTVILLGLMGTFFGLMYSVATAGGAIDNSTTQGTLDTIQSLFQGMKGIFGTSLCGLFAALILNVSRSILVSRRDAFMSRLDALTLDMQGGAVEVEDASKSEMERLFGMVSDNLTAMAAKVEESLNGVISQVGKELSGVSDSLTKEVRSSIELLSEKVNDSVGRISVEVTKSFTPLSDNLTNLLSSAKEVASATSGISTAIGGLSSTVADGIAKGLETAMEGASKQISSSVAEQVKQSGEQWKNFMDCLSAESEANKAKQESGLEDLKNVALQVAEKAQASSAELSADLSQKLGALSDNILGAFQKLSDTSAVLLDAQKALTESIDQRVVKEKEATDALGGNIVETAELMRVNQSELSANLEMLRSGLETILEKLSGDTKEQVEEENFIEHLNQSLEAFHERASEVLMENAVRTQEILLEVMEQIQRASIAAQPPKAEG